MLSFNGSPHKLAGLAGLLATIPMTAVMLLGRRILKKNYRPILPDQVMKGSLEKIPGAKDAEEMNAVQFETATWSGHFSFGAAAGAFYPSVERFLLKLPRLARGGVFGLSVWAASYWGWLPLLGIHASPKQSTTSYNAMGVLSHMVWGVAFVEVYHQLKVERD